MRFSIVIPTRSRPDHLQRALSSVEKNICEQLREIIVVDNHDTPSISTTDLESALLSEKLIVIHCPNQDPVVYLDLADKSLA
jgi:hypothetical protein